MRRKMPMTIADSWYEVMLDTTPAEVKAAMKEIGSLRDADLFSDALAARGYPVRLSAPFSALWGWSRCRQVFRFNPETETMLCNTDPRALGARVLTEMPYPCCFIEHAGTLFRDYMNMQARYMGAFIQFEPSGRYPIVELTLIGTWEDPAMLERFKDDLQHCFTRSFILDLDREAKTVGDCLDQLLGDVQTGRSVNIGPGAMSNLTKSDYDGVKQYLCEVTSLCAFVISQERDIETIYVPRSTHASNVRQGLSDAHVHQAGKLFGCQIGEARKVYLQEKELAGDEGRAAGEPVRHVAPHMRRAHWHNYWEGPRDGERRLVPHWVPPVGVNLHLGEVQTKVHRSKDSQERG